MEEATKDEKARLGAEIRRVREQRPKISRQRVADEAQVAEGTVRAVERGASIDHSTRRVMEALARLGRPVEPAPAEDPSANGANERPDQARGASTESLNEVELTVRLVESTLNAAPPEERNALESNIWLLIRGRNTELIERLAAPSE